MSDLHEHYVHLNEKIQLFKNTPLWEMIKEYALNDIKDIDANWHLYEEGSKEVGELRIRKRALTYLLNIEGMLKMQIDGVGKQIFTNDNTDIVIPRDYDNETKLEEKKDGCKEGDMYGV